jgi:site-specific DNA-adenine methylase
VTWLSLPILWHDYRMGLRIPYPGGKGRIASRIVSHMPQTGIRYIEPFVGRGNVFFFAAERLSYEGWWINDIDRNDFYYALFGVSRDLTVHIREASPSEFQRLKAGSKLPMPGFSCEYLPVDLSPEARESLLVEPWATYSGGGYAAGYSSKLGNPNKGVKLSGVRDVLLKCGAILSKKNVHVTNWDWKKIFRECAKHFPLGWGDFVYFDPPYMSARVHAYDSSKFDHQALVRELESAKYRWLLSEYRQPLYVEAFGEPFWRKDVQVAVGSKRAKRQFECLWKNY